MAVKEHIKVHGKKPSKDTKVKTSTKEEKDVKSKKAQKAAKGKKDEKGKSAKKRSPRGPVIADGKITLLTKKNPKREGTRAHKRFNLYFKHKTVKDFLANGGKRSTLRWDERHGYIKLSGVKSKAETKKTEKKEKKTKKSK